MFQFRKSQILTNRSINARWYLDYLTRITPPRPANLAYAQMIRPDFWRSSTFTQTTEATLQANPGALWIVGNEPDRGSQDGLQPEEFAVFYHEVYTFLKTRDPHSHIATCYSISLRARLASR